MRVSVESDTISGLGGNDVICVDEGNDFIDGGTGNDLLIGDSVTGVPPPFADHAGSRERFGLDERTPTVLVFGGSLGARSVNEAAVGGLTGLRAPALDGSGETDVAVLHASGRRDFPELAPRVREAGGARAVRLRRLLQRDRLEPECQLRSREGRPARAVPDSGAHLVRRGLGR